MKESQDLQLKLVNQQEPDAHSSDASEHHHHHHSSGSYDGYHHHSSGSSEGHHHHHHSSGSSEGHHHHHHSSGSSEGHHHHHHSSGSSEEHHRREDGHRGSSRSGSASGQRRRVYKDYGSIILGDLDRIREAPETPNNPSQPEMPKAPSQGELQREFMEKYTPVLNRKYSNSRKIKLWQILAITLVVLAAVVLTVLLISKAKSQPDSEAAYQAGEMAPQAPNEAQVP